MSRIRTLLLGIVFLLVAVPVTTSQKSETGSQQRSDLKLTLKISPEIGYAPLVLTGTFRFNQPVLGEVCIEAVATSEDAEIFYRKTCEGVNGVVRQIRWKWPWAGEFSVRGTYRGGIDTVITTDQRLIVKPPIGR